MKQFIRGQRFGAMKGVLEGLIDFIRFSKLRIMRALYLLIVIMAGCLSCCKECINPSSTVTRYIRDNDGRIVVYHGVNISNHAKHCNHGRAGVTWHGLREFDMLRQQGMNLVRYLVFWEALEPVEGHIDTEYLFKTVEKIKEIQACSLDVLVDMHQDLFCQKFGGDGFPEWMAKDDGKPFEPQNPWALNYLQPAVMACFTNFWTNNSLQDKYIKAFLTIVRALDTIPAVIGYDIINEPFPGYLTKFERVELPRFYEKVIRAVRNFGSTKLMFYEPWMSTSAGLPTALEFKPDSLCVYAPHYYNRVCESFKPYNVNDARMTKDALKLKVCEAKNFGSPMLLGEFGISERSTRFYAFITDVCDLADQYGFSWTYWSDDLESDSEFGLLSNPVTWNAKMAALTRIYPQRIAGDNPSWWYNGKKFSLEYTATGLQAPTVVFIPSSVKKVVISVDGIEIQKQAVGSSFVYQSSSTGLKRIEVIHE